MDRRKTLKTLLTGTVATALVIKSTGCDAPTDKVPASATDAETKGYGLRNAYEATRDERIAGESFFTDHELTVLTILGEIIVPGVTDSDFPDFVEFMALDQPDRHQTILRGGLAWLNAESSRRFEGKAFDEISEQQRIAIVDEIAYPDAEAEVQSPGVRFFNHARFMAATCFYTSKQGFDHLGYVGNQANVWDGPPQEVLDQYGLAYDEKYVPMYVNQETRGEQAEWDENMNLIKS